MEYFTGYRFGRRSFFSMYLSKRRVVGSQRFLESIEQQRKQLFELRTS